MKKTIVMLLCFIMMSGSITAVHAETEAENIITVRENGVAGGKVNYDVTIQNGIDADLICAVYNHEGKLVNVLKKESKQTQTVSVDTENMASGETRFFLWDSLSGMVPLSNAVVKPWRTTEPTIPPVSSEGLVLDHTTYALYVGNDASYGKWDEYGDYFTLNASILNDKYTSKDIEWNISDPEILAFKSKAETAAVIRARRTGIASVTAKLPDGTQASCTVTVIDNYTRLTVQRIEFNIDELNLKTGESAQVLPILYPKDVYENGMLDKSLTWQSSNPGVATVENGAVTAVGAGEATVTAVSADTGRKASFTVTVAQDVNTAQITPVQTGTLETVVGDTLQLQATSESEVVWRSENSFIADVDQNGLVTAYSNSNKQAVGEYGASFWEEPGTVKIYATAKDGGKIADYTLCVKDAPVQVHSVSLNKNNLNIVKGSQKNLTAVIGPANLLEKQITWSSSDESIVSVAHTNPTADGVNQAAVTAVSPGTATITAAYGGKQDTCTVTVTEDVVKISAIQLETAKEIDVDEVYQFTPEVTANATNQELIWIGTEDAVATVDREGNVMGYRPGKIQVYAIAKDALTEAQADTLMKLKKDGQRTFTEEMLAPYLSSYAVCELTVKDSSPYLRNVHVAKETVTESSVNLLWNRASLLDAEGFDQYAVYCNNELIAQTTTLGYTVDGLEPETAYDFKVAALDKQGNELVSETVSVLTKKQPAVLNVLDYGAKGNGRVMDTYAIQKAINACPEGGVVWLPEGSVFYSGALFLKSGITFRVDGILLGSIDPKDYPNIVTRWEGWRKLPQAASEWDNTENSPDPGKEYLRDNEYAHSSLVNAGTYQEGENSKTGPYNVKDITICGSGQINANGFSLAYMEGPNAKKRDNGNSYFKVPAPVTDATVRGRAVTTHNAQNVYMKDILIAYSPSWTVHSIYSDQVTYDGMKVISQGRGNVGDGTSVKQVGHLFNGDGIDPDSSTNINIFNVLFKTGDDAVAMKSGRNREGNELNKPNAYVRITDCESNFSLGGFGTGSETAGGGHDLLFQNLVVKDAAFYGIWLKTNAARGGITENVQVRDLNATGVNSVLTMNHDYSSSANNPANEAPVLRYVTIENVCGRGNYYGYQFAGLKNSNITDVLIRSPRFDIANTCKLSYCQSFEIWDDENAVWSGGSNVTFHYTKVYKDTKIKLAGNGNAVKQIDLERKAVLVVPEKTAAEVIAEIRSYEGGIQTYRVTDRNGEPKERDKTVVQGDRLLVTSPDGSALEEYTFENYVHKVNTAVELPVLNEDFSNVTDAAWGFQNNAAAYFEEAAVRDGALVLTKEKSPSRRKDARGISQKKEFCEEIKGTKKLRVSFKYKSLVTDQENKGSSANGDNSGIIFTDRNDKLVFALNAGTNKDANRRILYTTANNDGVTSDELLNQNLSGGYPRYILAANEVDKNKNQWYTIDLDINFEKRIIETTVTREDGTVLVDGAYAQCDGSDLSSLYAANFNDGEGTQCIDDVKIISADTGLEIVQKEEVSDVCGYYADVDTTAFAGNTVAEWTITSGTAEKIVYKALDGLGSGTVRIGLVVNGIMPADTEAVTVRFVSSSAGTQSGQITTANETAVADAIGADYLCVLEAGQ